jgi:hypothetical protein
MRYPGLYLMLLVGLCGSGQSFTALDSLLITESGSFRYTQRINRYPCEYDSTRTCVTFDTLSVVRFRPNSVHEWADSIALSIGVPPNFVKEVGRNESGWRNPTDLDYLIRNGDLQIIPATYNHWYKKLGLSGGKTRYNYLIIGIHYLKYCHDVGDGTWRQARYIYARGAWKHPSKWTKLEWHFMGDIDWTQYD